MSPFGPWAGLPSELLLIISNDCGLPFESYRRVRGVCTAWRAAIPPPIPSLITVAIPSAAPPHDLIPNSYVQYHPMERPVQLSALFLPADRSFHLATLPVFGECVGSNSGWLAVVNYMQEIFLLNPLDGGKQIPLRPLRNDRKPVPKVVFAPHPTPDDYVAVVICDLRRLAYTKTRDKKWMIIDVDTRKTDRLANLAYDTDAGKVYCITTCGDVHVLHIPQGRRRRPIVEPLQVERAGLPFKPAAIYAAPYDTASKFTGIKKIFFFDGGVYQLWRNTTSAASWPRPGGGRLCVEKDEVFVLKYDPGRQPCWDVAKDLGGCALFIGKNNPVVLWPEDASGVSPDCVYWVDESNDELKVFDMATGSSTLHPSSAKVLNPSCRPACWYFLGDKITSIRDNGRKRRISKEDCGPLMKNQEVHYGWTEQKIRYGSFAFLCSMPWSCQ